MHTNKKIRNSFQIFLLVVDELFNTKVETQALQIDKLSRKEMNFLNKVVDSFFFTEFTDTLIGRDFSQKCVF